MFGSLIFFLVFSTNCIHFSRNEKNFKYESKMLLVDFTIQDVICVNFRDAKYSNNVSALVVFKKNTEIYQNLYSIQGSVTTQLGRDVELPFNTSYFDFILCLFNLKKELDKGQILFIQHKKHLGFIRRNTNS
ncbi:hypothetical protein MXB_188, partial [Myxobolus squamalis]